MKIAKPLNAMLQNIIASEKNHYKKENDTRLIEVEIHQPISNENVWECTLIMNGYGEVNQTLFGQTSMQALSFAMQRAKQNLYLMINDGYCYYEDDENILYSKTETLELLNATYGVGTMLDDAHKKATHLQYINRLLKANGTEEEQNADIIYLRKEFNDPKIIDYIFNTKPELTTLEIYEKAIIYKSIQL